VATASGKAGVAGAAGLATAGGAAATHQAGQAILADDLAGAITANAWPQLDPHNIRGTLPRLVAMVMALIHRYGSASSAHAAAYYRAARADAGIPGRVTIRPAALPSTEQVAKSLSWATSGLYGSVTPDTEQAALTNVEGLTTSLALNMGRETLIGAVKDDRQAKGWARVPEPGACSFCLLLATRGAVYKSKASAGANARSVHHKTRAGQEFAGAGEFKVHDHCRCHVEPTFSDHYEPTAQVRQAMDLYAATPYGSSPKEARNNFRVALKREREAGRI
jgi:hypothetical protein